MTKWTKHTGGGGAKNHYPVRSVGLGELEITEKKKECRRKLFLLSKCL